VIEYHVSSTTGRCCVTGRELSEGEEYFSVLFDRQEGLVRQDFCSEAWTGPPPGAYCHWKARMAAQAPPKRLWVDNEALINLFLRLAEETNPARMAFRFVLALILMRKRILKYEETLADESGERWRMTLVTDKSVHQVVNPQMDEQKIRQVTAELSAILHGDPGSRLENGSSASAPYGGADRSAADGAPDA